MATVDVRNNKNPVLALLIVICNRSSRNKFDRSEKDLPVYNPQKSETACSPPIMYGTEKREKTYGRTSIDIFWHEENKVYYKVLNLSKVS